MKKTLLCGLCCLLALALAACGREAKEDRPLTILLSVEANTLDPHYATSTIEWSILMNMFDSLVHRRDDMTLAPALAERWEVDETKKVWTFHLRKGVKFHNGEPFDSESVRYTFERMRDEKLKPRITVHRRIFLDKVETTDSHTVKIHTRRPVATLPVWMVNALMLPPAHYASTPPKELLRKPVGHRTIQTREVGQGRSNRDGGQRWLVERPADHREGGVEAGAGGLGPDSGTGDGRSGHHHEHLSRSVKRHPGERGRAAVSGHTGRPPGVSRDSHGPTAFWATGAFARR